MTRQIFHTARPARKTLPTLSVPVKEAKERLGYQVIYTDGVSISPAVNSYFNNLHDAAVYVEAIYDKAHFDMYACGDPDSTTQWFKDHMGAVDPSNRQWSWKIVIR